MRWQSSNVPVDRDRVHVRRVDRRHLAPLHVAHAALRVEHDDLGAAARREARDGRRAGVARGRDEHRDALVALAQHVVEEPADELQREILEGQRRAVEELEQPLAGVELDERADGRMAEARVGLGAQPLEQRGLELVARERPDDAARRRARTARRARARAARASARARTGRRRSRARRAGCRRSRAPGRGRGSRCSARLRR